VFANTFYLAGSTSNIKTLRSRAKDLEQRGLRWVNNHPWVTDEVNMLQMGKSSKDLENGPVIRAGLAAKDICGASGAALFVAVISNHSQRGVFFEIGARIGANKEAHIIIEDGTKDYLFYHHPCALIYESWNDFIMACFPFEGNIPSDVSLTD
jgi:hypothetical protein